MWASVPQSPTADTRTSTSRGETAGRGTSRTAILPMSKSTPARIIGPASALELLLSIIVAALKRETSLRLLLLLTDIAYIQPPGIAQRRESLHRFLHASLERRCWQFSDYPADRSVVDRRRDGNGWSAKGNQLAVRP